MSTIVSPIASATGAGFQAAARPAQLDGGTLGVLINGKEYSDVVLRRLARMLAERHGFAEVLWWDKRYPATPAPFIEDIAARSTFVLNGVGH